ncbi:hypothetical protein EJB05_26185, partial [Eragrostis curvula]
MTCSSSSSSGGDEKPESSTKCANAISIAARIAAMGLAVAAAALMATRARAPSTPLTARAPAPSPTATTAPTCTLQYKTHMFLVIANAMAAFLGAIAVFLSVWKKGETRSRAC